MMTWSHENCPSYYYCSSPHLSFVCSQRDSFSFWAPLSSVSSCSHFSRYLIQTAALLFLNWVFWPPYRIWFTFKLFPELIFFLFTSSSCFLKHTINCFAITSLFSSHWPLILLLVTEPVNFIFFPAIVWTEWSSWITSFCSSC